MPPDRRDTDPALRIVTGDTVPPSTRPEVEPTNGELLRHLKGHAELDARELTDIKRKLAWQTFILTVVTAVATIIGALAHSG